MRLLIWGNGGTYVVTVYVVHVVYYPDVIQLMSVDWTRNAYQVGRETSNHFLSTEETEKSMHPHCDWLSMPRCVVGRDMVCRQA